MASVTYHDPRRIGGGDYDPLRNAMLAKEGELQGSLRRFALEQAAKSGEPHETTVQRAEAYLAFLLNEEKRNG